MALVSVNIRIFFAAVSFIFSELKLMFDDEKTPSKRGIDL